MQYQRLQRECGGLQPGRMLLGKQPQAILQAALIQALGPLSVHPDLLWVAVACLFQSCFDNRVRITRQTLYSLQ